MAFDYERVTTGQFAYDARGRITSSTDAAGRTVATAYTPAAGAAAGSGPLSKTTVTNALGWVSSATVDPYRGLPTTAIDDNGKTTTTEYDALGRLTKVWLTDRPKASFASSPSLSYAYTVSATTPSSVKETSLTATGTVSGFALVDGLGRPIQTQAPAPGGGAVISDTVYDAAGRETAVNDKYWAPEVTPGATLFVPASTAQIPARLETVYDGAGRATASVLRSSGAELRRTTTAYPGSDRVNVTPPSGGVATSTYFDAWGRTSKVSQWHGAIGGAGVGATSLQYEYNGRDQMTRMVDDVGNAWTWTFDLRGRQVASTDPDSGASSLTHDDLGNVVTSTDARGKTLAFTYDALNRKTTERTGSTTGAVLASWVYDTLAKGQLTSSSRFVDAKEYKTQITGYDDAYRPTGSSVVIPTGAPAFGGTTYASETYYNQDGSVTAEVLPAIAGLPAEELYRSYDTLGNLNSLAGASIYTSQVSYLASGQVGQVIRPGTVWSALTLTYAPGTRELASLDETTRRGGTTFTREALREYTRNASGLITKAATTADGQVTDTQCFTYDALQALTAAWSSSTADCAAGAGGALGGPAPYSATYTVDKVTGNRTASTVKIGAAATATTSTYTYPAAGSARPHAPTQVQATTGSASSTATYQYDASGGMTKRGAQTLSYDDSGRVASVVDGAKTEQSIYTADGDLLLRFGGSDGASLFLGSTVVRDVGGVKTGIRSYSVAGLSIAERVSGTGGGLWWLSPDPVGTVGLQISASSGVVTRRWMDPFGVPRGWASSWSSNFGYLNAPRSATGLTQLGARAYDPVLGKFISPDPLLDLTDPRQLNGYSYSLNSPVSYSDASGLIPLGATDRGDATYRHPAQNHSVGKSTTSTSGKSGSSGGKKGAPAAAGGSSGSGTPTAAQPEQWWNPFSWTSDTWRGVGAVATGIAVGVGIGAALAGSAACVVFTVGVCAVAIGVVAGAGSGLVTYGAMTDAGERTPEGYANAAGTGAAFGAAGGIAAKILSTVIGKIAANGRVAIPTVPGNATHSLVTQSPRQLQAKFKHAADFGVSGNYNKVTSAEYGAAINRHLESPATAAVEGTYRGQSVVHYLNPQTGLNVVARDGQFVTGWKLSPGQMENVLRDGSLGGG